MELMIFFVKLIVKYDCSINQYEHHEGDNTTHKTQFGVFRMSRQLLTECNMITDEFACVDMQWNGSLHQMCAAKRV